MIPLIQQALMYGFTAAQIINFIGKKVPSMNQGITAAKSRGYSDEDILKFIQGKIKVGKTKPESEMSAGERAMKGSGLLTPEEKKAEKAKYLKGALGAAGTAMAAYAAYRGLTGGKALQPQVMPALQQPAPVSAQPATFNIQPQNRALPMQGMVGAQVQGQAQAPIAKAMQIGMTQPSGAPINVAPPQNLFSQLTKDIDTSKISGGQQKTLNFLAHIADKLQQEGRDLNDPAVKRLKKRIQAVVLGKAPMLEEAANEQEITSEIPQEMQNIQTQMQPEEPVMQKEEKEEKIPQTGKPYQLNFVRNTKSSTQLGSRFGQDIEPHGRYMSEGKPEHIQGMPNMESGTVNFENPLVMEWGEGYGEKGNWKNVLSEKYNGKTGKALSQAIRNDGYDAIITTEKDKRGNIYTSEIVDLTSFKPTKKAAQPPKEPPPPTIEKNDIVPTPDGEFGTIVGMSGNNILVDVNGKKIKVNKSELKDPVDIRNALHIAGQIPESERSAGMDVLNYVPEFGLLTIQYPSGDTYWYKDIDMSLVDEILSATGTPTTSGKTKTGEEWSSVIPDSRFSVVSKKIVRDPKYAKANEGVTWGKIAKKYNKYARLEQVPKKRKKSEEA